MGKKIYTNYIQNERMSNDAFKLERLVNKSSQAFMIAGQGLCSVQTAEKLMLWSFYGHPHPFAGLVLNKHICCERESLKLTDVTCLPPVSAGQPISKPDLRVDLTLP